MAYSYLKRISNWNYIFILTLTWLILIAVVNPAGNFPLGDDWSYAKSVENLIKHGKVEFTGWTSMPLIAQTLWGSLFSLIFGFSFTTLRFSTLLLGLFGALGANEFLKESGVKPLGAFIGSALLAVNPFYFQLSSSFATDVPFFAFSIWAALFYVRTYRKNTISDFAIAVLLTAVACLIRDLAIALPIAFAMGLALTRRANKKILIYAGISMVSAVLVFLLWRLWLEHYHGLPDLYDEGRQRMLQNATSGILNLLKHILKNIFYALFFVCFFSLPALLAGVNLRNLNKKEVAGPALLFFTTSILLIFYLRKMTENISRYLLETALWPYFPEPVHQKTIDSAMVLPFWLNAIVTFLAFFALFLMFMRISELYIKKDKRPNFTFSKAMSVSLIAVYLAPITIAGIYNRYLIFLLPFVFLLVINESRLDFKRKFSVAPVILAFVVFVYLSASMTRDWLAINRLRFDILNFLVDEGISPKEIDGGFEFNGWYNYDENYIKRPGKNWWWVYEDTFAVSYYVPKGYELINKYRYKRWFLPGFQGYLYLSGIRRFDENTLPDNLALHKDEAVF